MTPHEIGTKGEATVIVLRRTSRGFLRGDFQDLNGDSCSIQESSSAQAPAIWLGANHGTHHHVTGDCLARMHLSIPLCEALIPLLRHFIEHGELPEGPLRQGGPILRGAEAMTPHEIIAGLLAGIDDAEGSGPVWDAELLAAARDYLASPEGPPAPLPEPDQPAPGRREAMSEWPNPGAAKAAIERLQEQAQQAESRADQVEAEVVELRGLLRAVQGWLDGTPESQAQALKVIERALTSPSPVAEALGRRDDPPKMVTITLQDYALPPECGRYSQAEILRGQGPGEFFGALTKALFDLQRGPGGVLLRSFVTGGEAPR